MSKIETPIGQYSIWGDDSLLDGNIITKDNKN